MIKIALFFVISLLSTFIQAEKLKEENTNSVLNELRDKVTSLEAIIAQIESNMHTKTDQLRSKALELEKEVNTQKDSISTLSTQNESLISLNHELAESLAISLNNTRDQDLRISEIFETINKTEDKQWSWGQIISFVATVMASTATVLLAFYASKWKAQIDKQDETERVRQADYFERDVKYKTLNELLDAHRVYINCFINKQTYENSTREPPENIEHQYKASLEQYGSIYYKYRVFFNDDGSMITKESPAFILSFLDALSKDHPKLSPEEQRKDILRAIQRISIEQHETIYIGIKSFFNRQTSSKK